MSDELNLEYGYDPIDVTSLHRPDVGRVLTDTHGHQHAWHEVGVPTPASTYNPGISYEMPSLVWVKDGEEMWEDDDEPRDVGHHECRLCGERIEPSYTADTNRVFIPGLRWYRINGKSVTEAEFRAAVERSR